MVLPLGPQNIQATIPYNVIRQYITILMNGFINDKAIAGKNATAPTSILI